MKLTAICVFGIEAVLKRELIQLGYDITETTNGRVSFEGGLRDVAVCNIRLRTAERIMIEAADFVCRSFDELFEGVKRIDWGGYIKKDGAFPVNATCIDSKLHSTRDCQSVAKKAVAEKLGESYGATTMPEDGEGFPIEIFIRKDRCRIYIDTTGTPLYKRGYRKLNVEAPLRETIAAALILLSYWKPERLFLDPFCGSGTFPIEAAMIKMDMAPGLKRDFLFEKWDSSYLKMTEEVRKEASKNIKKCEDVSIIGSDISKRNIEISKTHSEYAGTQNAINFIVSDFKRNIPAGGYGVLMCNPPYGLRIGEKGDVTDRIYRDLGEYVKKLPTWSKYILTDDFNFEKKSGLKADKKRKIYNGGIACTFYQFYGPKPV